MRKQKSCEVIVKTKPTSEITIVVLLICSCSGKQQSKLSEIEVQCVPRGEYVAKIARVQSKKEQRGRRKFVFYHRIKNIELSVLQV